ncbi:MAG: hypothetical protein QQW96_01990 [Tychonema bourrellyi B0820]|nr:hypothetical protein [Tychonema bourrellyi B0820]
MGNGALGIGHWALGIGHWVKQITLRLRRAPQITNNPSTPLRAPQITNNQ